jgi:hypothetical protein
MVSVLFEEYNKCFNYDLWVFLGAMGRVVRGSGGAGVGDNRPSRYLVYVQ